MLLAKNKFEWLFLVKLSIYLNNWQKYDITKILADELLHQIHVKYMCSKSIKDPVNATYWDSFGVVLTGG